MINIRKLEAELWESADFDKQPILYACFGVVVFALCL